MALFRDCSGYFVMEIGGGLGPIGWVVREIRRFFGWPVRGLRRCAAGPGEAGNGRGFGLDVVGGAGALVDGGGFSGGMRASRGFGLQREFYSGEGILLKKIIVAFSSFDRDFGRLQVGQAE